jgi:hypothetical protein
MSPCSYDGPRVDDQHVRAARDRESIASKATAADRPPPWRRRTSNRAVRPHAQLVDRARAEGVAGGEHHLAPR